MVNLIEEKIKLGDKEDVLKIHLLIKCFENGYNLSMADVCVLVELHKNGYNEQFYKDCVEKGYYKTLQTVRNSVSKMTKLGILLSKKRGERTVNTDFIPDMSADKVIFKYTVGNI